MTTSREAMVRALVDSDIRTGLGDPVQVDAWRELEWRRCGRDFEHFRLNYCYIILKSGRIIPWDDPYPLQVNAIKEWQSGESTIEVKGRQLGETTNGSHYALHDCMFGDAVIWNLFGADDDASKDIKRRLDATLDRLPQWMKDRAQMTAGAKSSDDIKRKNRQEAATILTFGLSMMRVLTGSVKKAQGLTGKTLWDDAGKHVDPERKWQLMQPTIDDPDPDNKGQIIIIFNGNGEDFLFHLYQKAKKGEVSLKAHFYSCEDDPRRWFFVDPDTGIGTHSRLSDRELVWPWYDYTERQYLITNPDQDRYAFRAQHPRTEEEAFYVTGNSFFDLKMINGLSKLTHHANAPRVRHVALRNAGEDEHHIPRFEFHPASSGRYRLYNDRTEDAYYILGCDPVGGGVNGDYAVGTMCEFLRNGAEVAERAKLYGYDKPPKLDGERPFTFEETCWALDVSAVYQHRTEPVGFALEMERFARHYNDAFAVIESNAAGGTMISHIKDSYWNLYRQVRKDTKFTDEYGEVIGYWETERSKAEMLHDLNYWLSKGWIFLHDGPTIAEMSRFGYDDRGKLKAPKGLHDDLVFGIGLCVVGARDLMLAPQDGKLVNFGLEW